jgi:hypothetical protein
VSRYSGRFLALAVTLAALATCWPATAGAQGRGRGRGPVVVVGGGYYGGYVYDPFFGPYPFGPYGYPLYYRGGYSDEADVRVLVTPKDAEVYVDGYYAGIVDNFDGVFQRLSVGPGGHEFVLYRDGYRTVSQTAYLSPRSTFKLSYTMVPLSPGETPEPRPAPASVQQTPQPFGPPPGRMPGMGRPAGPPPRQPAPPVQAGPPVQPEPRVQVQPPASQQLTEGTRFGTLAIRAQPADAEVLVDGELWGGPVAGERLLVQVIEGRHRVEIRKGGYQPFSTEIQVRGGETVPINVNLPQTK